MGILKNLLSVFGGSGGGGEAADSGPEQAVEYQGFTIRATPYKEEGQYQTCGVIAKEVDGVMKEHRFVRADRYASRDDAVSFTFDKGRQIVDQTARMGGKSLFD